MKKLSIAFKLSLYFTLALLAFALIVGSVFFVLFRKQSVEVSKKQLEDRAEAIALNFGDFVDQSQKNVEIHNEEGEGTESGNKRGTGKGKGSGEGKGMGYQAYLRFLDEIAMADVWLVDSAHNLVTPTHLDHNNQSTTTYNYGDLPPDAESVVDRAFQGEVTSSEGFSGVLEQPTLTVGAPVKSEAGDIVSVVLLHSPVDVLETIPNDGLKSLITALAVALILGTVMAVILGRSFTKPMKEMQIMAGQLANGDYTAKSHVKRQDEIGQLANSLDSLSHQLKLSSEEHERFQQMQQAFFSNISHELKTPVTVLCGSLEALSTGVVKDSQKVAEYHEEMYHESLALKALVNDLLDLSRLQSVAFRLNMEVINFCDVINDAKRSAQNLAQSKNIRVHTNLENSIYKIEGDYLRLRQLLMILLNNAIKFSEPNTEIQLTLGENRLEIKDQGCGIDTEILPHIFERFYKTLTAQNAEGTGLGLAIAKEISDRHHIVIEIESIPEQGTKFCLILPKEA